MKNFKSCTLKNRRRKLNKQLKLIRLYTISPIITSLGPNRFKAANMLNERINQNAKSIDKIIRAAQKHSAVGRNRNVKPTKKKIIAKTSNLFQKSLK